MEEYTLKDLIKILIGRWKVLLMIAVFMFIISFLGTLFLPNIYTGEAILVVVKSKMGGEGQALALDTFSYLVENRGILKNILAELLEYRKSRPDSPLPRKMTLRAFQKRINVRQIRNTDLVSVSVKLEDPVWATEIANRLANAAIAKNFAILNSETKESQNIVGEQLITEASRFNDIEEDVIDFSVKTHLASLQKKLDSRLVIVTQLEYDEALLINQISDLEARLEKLDVLMKEEPKTIVLRRTISEDVELMALAKTAIPDVTSDENLLALGLNLEVVNAVRQSIEQNRFEIMAQLDGLRAKLKTIRDQLGELREETRILEEDYNQKQLEYKRLEIEYSTLQSSYQNSKKIDSEVKTLVATRRQDLQMADQAVIPERPSGPIRPLIALIVSLMCTSLAFTFLTIRDIYHLF